MFTAKDFPKVPPTLKAVMPDDPKTLIHRQVRKTGVDKKLMIRNCFLKRSSIGI